MASSRLLFAAVLLAGGAALIAAPARGQNPLGRGQQDQRPFAGTFQGKDIALELETAEAGYRGWLTFEGRRYPCTATEREGALDGSFRSGGEDFPFRARLQGARLSLTSGGNDYQLERSERKAAASGLPAFLAPGMRLTYEAGNATVQGVRSRLVQDDKGNWLDPTTGKHWSDQETRSSGGVGYTQLNVVRADRDVIAIDVHNWLLADLQNRQVISSGSVPLLGDGQGVGDWWQHPQKLAKLDSAGDKSVRVWRGPYRFGDKTVQAVTVTTTTATSFTNLTYDQETGLLLVMASSATGPQVPTLGNNGQVNTGPGTAQQSHARFVGMRKLDLPWAGSGLPEWCKRGRTFDYQGTYGTQIQGGLPLQPFRLGVSIAIDQVQDGFVMATVSSRLHTDPVQDSRSERLFGAATIGGLFVDPKALQAMKPGQVIDQDPVTQVRVRFAGVQDGAAVLVEECALETASYAYDLRTGMLAGSSTSQRNQVGTLQIGLRLVNQR
jgi:hypothetical protein